MQVAAHIFGALHRKNAELSQPSMIIAGVNTYISRVVGAGPGGGGSSSGGGGGLVEEEDEARCLPLYDKAFASAFALCAGACFGHATVVTVVTVVGRAEA